MIASISGASRQRQWAIRAIILAAAAFVLASCGGMSKLGNLFSDSESPQLQTMPSAPTGEGVKVALLLPTT
ncbi:MAG: hypothetical protein ACREDW_07855, partial [Aestuariivirgaceae bacterium]